MPYVSYEQMIKLKLLFCPSFHSFFFVLFFVFVGGFFVFFFVVISFITTSVETLRSKVGLL